MRNLFLALVLLFALGCTAQSSAIIDINHIKSTVFANGELFHLADSITGVEEAPIGSGNSINFQGRVWMGGLYGDTLFASTNYIPGPLDTINGLPTNSGVNYNHVWKITKSMILDFQQNYQNGESYIHPEILTWPANGDPAHYEAQALAPFVDLNNNGIYETFLGEYPELHGDEMLYWIFNNQTTDSLTCNTIGLEIHGMAYAYLCDAINPDSADEALNNTVFYKYTVHNRTSHLVNEFNFGWWQNPNLGNANDDFIGCDTMRNAAFIYNGDNDDEGGYGLNPPMQSYLQLDGPLAPVLDGWDNDHDGTIDEVGEKKLFNGFMTYSNNYSTVGIPENCLHVYQYLKDRVKDNTPFVNNGTNGYGSGPVTRFLYSGIPYSGQPWTESTAGNTPHNRLFLLSSGPTTLQARSSQTYEYATVFSHNSTAANGLSTSLALNNAYVDKVRQWYEAQSFPSCYSPTGLTSKPVAPAVQLYPNPVSDKLTIAMGNEPYSITITNVAGNTNLSQAELQGKQVIDVAGFVPGVYIVTVRTAVGLLHSKFIKN